MKVSFFQFVLAIVFLFLCLFLVSVMPAATVERSRLVVERLHYAPQRPVPNLSDWRLDECLERHCLEIQQFLEKAES